MQYRDIDINFKLSPVTKDLMTATDANAVATALHNILMCKKLWNFDNLGLGQLMFNTYQDILSGTVIMSNIEKYLLEHEPRLAYLHVEGLTDIGDNTVLIDITFAIKNKLGATYKTNVAVSENM